MRARWTLLALALACAGQALGQGIEFRPASSGGGTADPLSLTNITGTTSSCGGAASGAANSVCLSSNAITGEGSTADTSETRVAFGDATADQTLTCTGAASSFGCVVAAPATAASSTAGNGLALTASAATAGSSNAGAAAGGSVTITAGAAARLTSGNADGGNVVVVGGAGIGTGALGYLVVGSGTTNGRILLDGSASSDTFFVGDQASGLFITTSSAATVPKAVFHSVSVETVATTKAPGVTESLELYSNGSDVDGQAITLPNDPTVGVCYEFALTSTDSSGSFAIAAAAGETLMDAATTCSTSFSATAKGATARICAVSGGSGGLWLVMSKNGTWTCS